MRTLEVRRGEWHKAYGQWFSDRGKPWSVLVSDLPRRARELLGDFGWSRLSGQKIGSRLVVQQVDDLQGDDLDAALIRLSGVSYPGMEVASFVRLTGRQDAALLQFLGLDRGFDHVKIRVYSKSSVRVADCRLFNSKPFKVVDVKDVFTLRGRRVLLVCESIRDSHFEALASFDDLKRDDWKSHLHLIGKEVMVWWHETVRDGSVRVPADAIATEVIGGKRVTNPSR